MNGEEPTGHSERVLPSRLIERSPVAGSEALNCINAAGGPAATRGDRLFLPFLDGAGGTPSRNGTARFGA